MSVLIVVMLVLFIVEVGGVVGMFVGGFDFVKIVLVGDFGVDVGWGCWLEL